MKKIFLLLLLISIQSHGQSSVLAAGKWIKVSVNKSGIYKIDKTFLEKHAPSFAQTEPDKLRIYTGHSSVLPQPNSAHAIQDLKEVPVYLNDENNQWDSGDFVAFYAAGPHSIEHIGGEFSHEINPYSDLNYYYLTAGNSPSLKLKSFDSEVRSEPQRQLSFYTYEEKELRNLLASGRLWVGDFFRPSYSFKPQAEDYDSGYKLRYELLPLGSARQYVEVFNNNILLKRDTLTGAPYNSNDNQDRYQRISNIHNFRISTEKAISDVELRLSSDGFGSSGVYFNYWALSYLRKLKFYPGQQITYRTLATDTSRLYSVENSSKNAAIWQISDTHSAEIIPIKNDNTFTLNKGSSEVIVFDLLHLATPIFKETVKNQNLQNTVIPEVLVVFPEKLRSQATRLIDYKRENEDFEIIGYSLTEIYNEYSSGKTDPTAIRNFCRDLYRKSSEKFKFLLILGDASYDFKNNNKAPYVDTDLLVPSYQSLESLEPIYSYASDDYFGFLDDHEGQWSEGYSINNRWISNREDNHLMDISVGRIPARSSLELSNYITKYISYKENNTIADWQNRFAFVADNRDYNIHQRDAENLETIALSTYPGIITDKLYLDDYPMENTNGNYTSPSANKKLHAMVNNGSYLITYIGHGAEDGLTGEKLLTFSDILSFSNPVKLPVWFTATCQFGKFDNPAVVSGAELSLLRPNGGAIALLTTTRAVYSSTNQLVNQAFFRNFNTVKTLGELFRITKNLSVQGEINRNFSLLGDPTLTLPDWKNETQIELDSDTLFALQTTSFTGRSPSVEKGNAILSILDKPSPRRTLGTFADGPAFDYALRSEPVFIGKYPIKNHQFSGEITLPVQQFLGTGPGRLLITITDMDSSRQEFGFQAPVIISSKQKEPSTDKEAPKLNAYLDNDLNLIWEISDNNGINISREDSNSILSMTLNGVEIENVYTFFSPIYENKKGQIRYYVGSLPNGSHSTTLISSDIHNNVSQATFDFQIRRPEIELSEITLYPVPVTDYLNIRVSHNKPGDNLNLSISLYDELGRTLWKESNNCTKCAETLNYSTDFSGLNATFPKVYYKVVLTSLSENKSDERSGSLFFWK